MAEVPAARIDADFVLHGPFRREDVAAMRAQLKQWMDGQSLRTAAMTTLGIVATELIANVILHGGGDGRLRVWWHAGSIVCQVVDHGPGMPKPYRAGWQPPYGDQPHGRGLWMVRVLCDVFTVDSGPLGTTITAIIGNARRHKYRRAAAR
jgi:anti-sigma regulatory factor (Ser/Thr protein kinase)